MNEAIRKEVQEMEREGFPVEVCKKCGEKAFVHEGEGITSLGEHYKLCSCYNCGSDEHGSI